MKRRAFTLIELLVVIAIIGLLSTIAVVSLSKARSNARDAKRQADLLQISKAIELYINDHGAPPRGADWCTFISNGSSGYGAAFQSDLSPYLAKVPLDPQKANQIGDYLYYCRDNISKYILCANLEQSTGQSYDYRPFCASAVIYNYCIMPNGT